MFFFEFLDCFRNRGRSSFLCLNFMFEIIYNYYYKILLFENIILK